MILGDRYTHRAIFLESVEQFQTYIDVLQEYDSQYFNDAEMKLVNRMKFQFYDGAKYFHFVIDEQIQKIIATAMFTDKDNDHKLLSEKEFYNLLSKEPRYDIV